MQNSAHLWNRLVAQTPNPHFLQTAEWAQVKAQYGWIPHYAVWETNGAFRVFADPAGIAEVRPAAAALILERPVLRRGMAARLSILYSPKGPLANWADEPLRARVLNDLQTFARRRSAIFLKIDPNVELGRGLPDGQANPLAGETGRSLQAELLRRGWRYSADQIQFKNTALLDLSQSEAELLARMKQKTRYNIRLAEKKGVRVRLGNAEDLPALYKMYAETSVRDGFVIRDEGYYMTVWRTFLSNFFPPQADSPFAVPLIAEVEGLPVAGLFLFLFAGRAYYVYGMSRSLHRDKMPTYLLQWEAIKFAKAAGCSIYDLWGAPEVFDESDTMWGVYRFKEGLGCEAFRGLGAYDFAPNFLWYKVYAEIMPRLLDVMRARGKEKTRRVLS